MFSIIIVRTRRTPSHFTFSIKKQTDEIRGEKKKERILITLIDVDID
jgi:hypothetical protein